MIVPILLVLASLACMAAALILPGWSDLILLAGPCALASMFLLVRTIDRRRRDALQQGRQWIVVDGSNVMYWKDRTPQIETVIEVVRHLSGMGFTAGVMFDANAGYLISGKYRHDGALGKILELPQDCVMVVPKGTVADAYILQAARDLGARIVTNDRYRDWADNHPEIHEPGYLIKGGYRAGRLWLDLEPVEAKTAHALD